MKSPIHDASARQHFGEPFSGLGPNNARKDRLRNQDLAEVDGEIARLVDRNGRILTMLPKRMRCVVRAAAAISKLGEGTGAVGCR